MIDKSSLLKSQGSLYLEFIPKDGLFHKMLLLSLMGFLTGWCNLTVTLRLGQQIWLQFNTCISHIARSDRVITTPQPILNHRVECANISACVQPVHRAL